MSASFVRGVAWESTATTTCAGERIGNGTSEDTTLTPRRSCARSAFKQAL